MAMLNNQMVYIISQVMGANSGFVPGVSISIVLGPVGPVGSVGDRR
jgi:hypothetical protein